LKNKNKLKLNITLISYKLNVSTKIMASIVYNFNYIETCIKLEG